MADHPDPPAEDDAPLPQPVQPRRNPATHRSAAATTTNLTDLVNLVKSVQAFAEEQSANQDAGPENNARRTRKFSRSGNGDERPAQHKPASEPTPAVAEAASVPAPVQEDPEGVNTAAPVHKTTAWPRLVKAEEPVPVPSPAKRPKRKKKNNGGIWVAVQVFCFSLIGLGYWLRGQMAHPTPNRDQSSTGSPADTRSQTPAAANRVSERAFASASAALMAAKNGDAAAARQLYETAATQNPALPGTSYRLALLAWQQGDLAETERQLALSVQVGENVAASSYVRARLEADRGDATESLRQLQLAAHTEPFDGRYLFYWGEALRRQGKFRAAIECLEQAVDRPNRPEEDAFYAFKLRLLRAETGHDEPLREEIAEGLRQPAGAGEWQLIAAAQDLARSAFNDAADHLKKAAATLPPARYDLLTRDYFFQNFAGQAPLTALLKRPLPNVEVKKWIDTTFASPEVADPALWPAETAR